MKKEKGTVKLIVTREFFNSLVTVLQFFVNVDSKNIYGKYASQLIDTIMLYSRPYSTEVADYAVMYFYENEASVLLYLYTMYFNATEDSREDYYKNIAHLKKNQSG